MRTASKCDRHHLVPPPGGSAGREAGLPAQVRPLTGGRGGARHGRRLQHGAVERAGHGRPELGGGQQRHRRPQLGHLPALRLGATLVDCRDGYRTVREITRRPGCSGDNLCGTMPHWQSVCVHLRRQPGPTGDGLQG